jgi:O-antigen/teichoic acid export membrane protein
LKNENSSPIAVIVTQFWTKARFLLGYGVLSVSAGAVLPVTYIIIRLLIQAHGGDKEFGFWQATLRISEAYTQLPLLLLNVVLFARFAGPNSIPAEIKRIKQAYILMAVVVGLSSIIVYFTRNYWVKIIFTADFEPMSAFLPWQLIGDALRIMSYVGTTILAAKGAVRICVVGEFVQGALLVCTNLILTPLFDVYGAYGAYIFTYALYFCASVAFILKLKKRPSNETAYS